MIRLRFLATAILALVLTGCDPFAAPDSMMDEYVERTARVLGGDAVLSPVPTGVQLPPRRERVRATPSLDVSMLEFLGLYGCDLQYVVGERNSILGRVMHVTSVLDYELRFVRAAEECADQISRPELAKRIAEVAEIKREALPAVVWNAVWGSREIEELLTRSKGLLPVSPDRDVLATLEVGLRTMEHIVRSIEQGETDVNLLPLDAVYQQWLHRPLAGQLLRSAALVAVRLDDTSRLIEARLGDHPVCARPDQRPRAAENMRGMFMSVYVGEVQPYLADLQRTRQALIPPLLYLASRQGVAGVPPVMEAYTRVALRDDVAESVWFQLDRSVARHARAWQELLQQCGMRPGQGAS